MADQVLTRLVAEIALDQSKLKRDLTGLKSALSGTVGRVAGELGTKFSNAFNVAMKTGLAAGLGGSLLVLRLSSDAAEVESKFQAVYKSLAGEAAEFAKTFASSIGRSVVDVKKQLASFQDTFVPLGFAREEAARLSKQLVALTADLASFNNESDAEVADKLIGTLIGNHENARSWGVIITENTLNQKLLAMGIRGGTAAASEQSKVLARLAILTDSTTDAQGDALKTASGFANSLKGLTGSLKDLAVEFGAALLPAALEVVKVLREQVAGLSQYRDAFVDFGKTFGASVSSAIASVKEFAANHAGLISGLVASVPRIAGFVLAVKSISAALSLSGFALISPGGAIIAGLTLLGLAFVDSRMKGQSWADSVAEWTATLFGFENAITASNAAIRANAASSARLKGESERGTRIETSLDDGSMTTQQLQSEIDSAKQTLRAEQDRAATSRKELDAVRKKIEEKNQIASMNSGTFYGPRFEDRQNSLESEGLKHKETQLADDITNADLAARALAKRIASYEGAFQSLSMKEQSDNAVAASEQRTTVTRESAQDFVAGAIGRTNATLKGLVSGVMGRPVEVVAPADGKQTTPADRLRGKSPEFSGVATGAAGLASGFRDMASEFATAMKTQWGKDREIEADARKKAGEQGKRIADERPRTAEFFSIADYAKNLQSAIGGNPKEKVQQDIKNNTGKSVPLLEQIAKWGEQTAIAVARPMIATAS
jgi:hypothetical protein